MQIKQRPYDEEALIRMEEVEFFVEDDDVIVLRRAIDAWKKSEEKTVYNNIIALTNKITRNYFEEQKNEFIAHVSNVEEEKMQKIVGIIFERAIEEPEFCKIYVDLCKAQISADRQNAQTSKFAEILITKTQRLFSFLFEDNSEELSDDQTLLENLFKERVKIEELLRNEELNATQRSNLRASLAEIEVKLKWKESGFINLIGYLHMAEIVNPKIVHYCLKKMLQRLRKSADQKIDWLDKSVESSILGFCFLLKLVGKHLAENSTPNEVETLRLLLNFLYDNRHLTANRIRFAIMDAHESATIS